MIIFAYIVISVLLWLCAMQVSPADIRRIFGIIESKWLPSNTIAAVCMLVMTATVVADCLTAGCLPTLAAIVASLFISAVIVFIMSKMRLPNIATTATVIIVIIALAALTLRFTGLKIGSVFCVFGFYYRNCPFGNIFGKAFLLLSNGSGQTWKDLSHEETAVDGKLISQMQDFSFAGCQHDSTSRRVFIVTDHDIRPDTNDDILPRLQQLIDHVGTTGGGTVFFPKGKYLLNNSPHGTFNFIRINHSDITLEGETQPDGTPAAELINCRSTVDGKRNPWLSPFMITTGEQIQRSNMFWGVQFKKRKNVTTRSSSMTDPGSDGNILTPEYITDITTDAKKGASTLIVNDAARLRGVKYILLAMFNNANGDLIRDILDTQTLRPEWTTARRAGDECAPSFQYLMEISAVNVRDSSVTLAQPLRRDVSTKYAPAIYKAEMLEHVCVKCLVISSTWNGTFRHHGFPIYYSVAQSQEMDYGWNGINMKRVAHGRIENVVFRNLTNPLYITDSRNITVENVKIAGHDGHQGIKVYEHACDNLLKHIVFRCHYADMMGGEGNAYGNVFTDVRYENPYLKPADFDFHGFSEGPMSPPSYNLFEQIYGFAHIKGAGAIYNQPACARENVWWNIQTAGERKGDCLFVNACYVGKGKAARRLRAIGYAVSIAMREHSFDTTRLCKVYKAKMEEYNARHIEPESHSRLFPQSMVIGITTANKVNADGNCASTTPVCQAPTSPASLYQSQLAHRKEPVKASPLP